MDLLATADDTPLPDDSTPGRLRTYAGGVGRNIAENLTRLGIKVTLVSAIGDDDFGRRIVEHDKKVGIDVSQIDVHSDLPTASYTALHNHDGELLYAISDMRIFDQFEIRSRPDTQADLLVIDANLPESTIHNLVHRYQPGFIAAEAVSRKKCLRLAGVLPYLSLLKVNRAEACSLTGLDAGNCNADNHERLIDALLQLGPAMVLLTLGKDGAMLASQQQVISAPSASVSVVSTSGVGDAMCSGVLAARLYGHTADEQLRWGTAAAAATLGVHSACADSLSLQSLGLRATDL